jgi:hypothetical protein
VANQTGGDLEFCIITETAPSSFLRVRKLLKIMSNWDRAVREGNASSRLRSAYHFENQVYFATLLVVDQRDLIRGCLSGFSPYRRGAEFLAQASPGSA